MRVHVLRPAQKYNPRVIIRTMSSLLHRVLGRRNAKGKRLLGRPRSKRERTRLRMRSGATLTEDEKIQRFEEWCREIGLELHPQLRIGRTGSCADVGVVARADIPRGALLAVIPRHTLLTASNSRVGVVLRRDRLCRKQLRRANSWVPLLLALLVEYGLKSSSYWHPYLTLVPSKTSPSPVLEWSHGQRRRLLGGTGVDERVERDQENIARDYRDIILPFMQRHPDLFGKTYHSQQLYEQLVCFVMAYSFTDAEEREVCERTMMVPFVDLLNHHSQHHAELSFHPDRLQLVAVREIRKGEEVMNTYGLLSNASLLHVYGFTESGNPHDVALIQSSTIRQVYESHDTSHDQRWERLSAEDVMLEEFEVDSSGHPEQALLAVIKLLLVEEQQYSQLRAGLLSEDSTGTRDLSLETMSKPEVEFMHRLCLECLAKFPESHEDLQSTAKTQTHLMTKREKYALLLTLGQQQCLLRLREASLQNCK